MVYERSTHGGLSFPTYRMGKVVPGPDAQQECRVVRPPLYSVNVVEVQTPHERTPRRRVEFQSPLYVGGTGRYLVLTVA